MNKSAKKDWLEIQDEHDKRLAERRGDESWYEEVYIIVACVVLWIICKMFLIIVFIFDNIFQKLKMWWTKWVQH